MGVLYRGGLSRGKAYKDIGNYTIPHGKHDIEFEFNYIVQTALLSCPSLEMPVCQGDINWFALTLRPKGFVVHADIRTDNATITWVTVEGLPTPDQFGEGNQE
jgi:hypothetical protein